jgi:hypothetical protein
MHWRNSNAQILYFIVGKAHTTDEAYRLLMELREERVISLALARANGLKNDAARLRAGAVVQRSKQTLGAAISTDEQRYLVQADLLDARATVAELDAYADQTKPCIDAAEQELLFIDQLVAKVQPHRKYAHLPDAEAHQACQVEEWKHELLFRAENYISAQGFVHMTN